MSMENYLETNYENNMKMLKEAISYCGQEFSHDDLIKELSSDNDIKKQLCIIEIKKVESVNEASLLAANLTGKSGPVREVCSFKFLELISDNEFQRFFQTKEILDIVIKAITDINPAVSRNMTEVVRYISDYKYLINGITDEINITLNDMENIKGQNRSYVLNKKIFNLYWNLEALISIADKIEINDVIVNIINSVSLLKEYTIREKAAKLISILNRPEFFSDAINRLQNDDNIYVKKYFD